MDAGESTLVVPRRHAIRGSISIATRKAKGNRIAERFLSQRHFRSVPQVDHGRRKIPCGHNRSLTPRKSISLGPWVIVVVFALGGSAVAGLGSWNVWHMHRQLTDAETTTGLVHSAEVRVQRSRNSDGRTRTYYVPDIQFAYQVDGQDYVSTRLYPGAMTVHEIAEWGRWRAERIIREYGPEPARPRMRRGGRSERSKPTTKILGWPCSSAKSRSVPRAFGAGRPAGAGTDGASAQRAPKHPQPHHVRGHEHPALCRIGDARVGERAAASHPHRRPSHRLHALRSLGRDRLGDQATDGP